MANVWNPSTGQWEDPVTRNYLYGGSGNGQGQWTGGTWMNPQGQAYVNGQWVGPNTPGHPSYQGGGMGQSAQQGAAGGSRGGSGSSYNPQSGFGWQLLQNAAAQETFMQQMRGQQAMEMTRLEDSTRRWTTEKEYELRMRLQAGEISQAKYDLEKKLAQQESEFARSLAQQQLEFKHKAEMDRISAEIAKGAEMREERELQARLAANPQDWVAYEFYKRAIGTPGVITAQGGVNGNPGPQGQAQQLTQMNGQPYEAAPPAYSDATAQSLATSLFNPGTSNGNQIYNPNLSGTGVFGAQIPAPNSLSRGEASQLTAAETGMIGGLLRAGIDMGGKRVALDPVDWFEQAEKSWIPTLAETTGGTRYS